MAVQKKKLSATRSNRRRAANSVTAPINANTCVSCGAAKLAHRACLKCGSYRQQKVV
ncbi:MAG: hypothetical protein CEO22_147 [Candidatus Berkelbacteria bacterium Gr01-1014_85]|uniref:Large ribosomal subunit protein bL32 n=1 Tax=Candidatus Berkelbacteria bacterium Gr01-1014_85 TaxID=2017150 RepID=A0A554JDI8_9BACT|nr:MAG: hypothetical protein CEO22_147 [Candidatus Berkelbacteria bacterium Gr01-1014_85]